MSLDTLTNSSNQTTNAPPLVKSRRSLTWLLPVGLLVGFLCIMALLFGKRLIPAVDVNTAPVITIRTGDQKTDPKSDSNVKSAVDENPASQTQGNMIFQASGWVEPDPYVTYVPTLINGVIDQVKVLEGQSVKKGELIATLIDDDAKLDLRQAEQKILQMKAQVDAHCTGTHISNAELTAVKRKVESLQASLIEAEDTLRRLESIPAGAVPIQQVVQARLAKTKQQALVAAAQAEIPQIRARLEQIEFERIAMLASISELETARDRAKLAMERTRILSPIDGVVLHLHAAPGKKRMLDMDDPKSAVIVELYDPKHLQARIDVPLTEAAGIRLGQIVELVSDLLPDMTFKGKVTRISGEADLQRNTLQAKVSISNPDERLRPEMLVRAKFFSTGRGSSSSSGKLQPSSNRLSLYVPESAIINSDSVWVVSSKQTAELRQVTLGSDNREGHRHVLNGLKSGEQVILPPHTDLENGTRVSSSSQSSN